MTLSSQPQLKCILHLTSSASSQPLNFKMKILRRQSLRPRQIDIHGKMLIIRSVEELNVFEDDTGAGQQITSLKDLNSLIDEPAQKPKRKKNIPIPFINSVANYEKDVPADFEIPTSYVRFQTIPQEGDENKIEVDLQVEDMEWLRIHPKYGENGDPRYQLSLEIFNKMIDILEKASGPIFPNLVTQNEAEELFNVKMHMYKTASNRVTLDIYHYWVHRRNRSKKPLLRRYWPQTPLNDTNPHLVFRPREKERYKLRKHRNKNDMEGFRKLQQLRDDFDKTRGMLKLVKRRERYKRLFVDILDEMRKQTMYELTDRSGRPRKPRIPTEDDRDTKQRKKKKKKQKKFRKESTDSVSRSGTLNRQSDSGHTSVLTVPTFMDYDTGAIKMASTPEPPEFPIIPSNPDIPPRVLPGPPRYKCRGRIGRGGRLLIDRVPMSSESSSYCVEEYARPSLYDSNTRMLKQSDGSTAHGEPEGPKATLLPPSLEVDSQRMLEIYRMNDSEDELLEPTSVTDLVDTTKPKIDLQRPIKYTLSI